MTIQAEICIPRRDMPSLQAAIVSLDPDSIHAAAFRGPFQVPKQSVKQKIQKSVITYFQILPGVDLIPWEVKISSFIWRAG